MAAGFGDKTVVIEPPALRSDVGRELERLHCVYVDVRG